MYRENEAVGDAEPRQDYVLETAREFYGAASSEQTSGLLGLASVLERKFAFFVKRCHSMHGANKVL